jgi:hypothetical protein
MEDLILAADALALVEKLIPIIAEKVHAGEIPVETQQALFDRYTSLKTRASLEFSQDYWQVERDPGQRGPGPS